MTAQELKAKFIPDKIVLGVLKDGQEALYEVENTSEIPIYGFTRSCSCVGDISTTDFQVSGKFTASYAEKGQELFLVDGKYCQKMAQGAGVRFFNVEDTGWAENPTDIEGPFKASLLSQSLVVWMDQPGVPDKIRTETGELKDNPDRLKFTLPITAWILKD